MADWANKCHSKVQIWWPGKWDARLEKLRGDHRRSTFARELLIEAVHRRLKPREKEIEIDEPPQRLMYPHWDHPKEVEPC